MHVKIALQLPGQKTKPNYIRSFTYFTKASRGAFCALHLHAIALHALRPHQCNDYQAAFAAALPRVARLRYLWRYMWK